MRFIIHEQPYERPLSSGTWEYYRDERPTGAVENWRLSSAVDGYSFLRVDLDARAATSGRSYLYHLTLDRDGSPLQLKFRLWANDTEIIGMVLLDKDTIIVTREIGGWRDEALIPVSDDYAFWFPASTGLGLLSKWQSVQSITGVGLRTGTGAIETEMSPFVTLLDLEVGEVGNLLIKDRSQQLKPLTIGWSDQQRRLWLDKDSRPLKMERSDGLVAIESHYTRVQRIRKPGTQPAAEAR